MFSLLQWLALAFITFAVSRALLRAKDRKISYAELVFWLGIWGVLVVVVFFPEITSYFAKIVGIGRGIDVIIYISIGLLFYLVFRIYVKMEETESSVTTLVRELSILEKTKKKK